MVRILPIFSYLVATALSLSAFAGEINGVFEFNGIINSDTTYGAVSAPCSGSLVRLDTSVGSDYAIVLTAGHCLRTGAERIINRPDSSDFRLLKPLYRYGNLTATSIIYRDTKNMDIALYKLKETYDDILRDFGVTALTLSRTPPGIGDKIKIISGYLHKIYTCTTRSFISSTDQTGQNQYWLDSIESENSSLCATEVDSSGSPMLDIQTSQVVGVHYAVYGPYPLGEQIFWLYDCLDSQNDFDSNQPRCIFRDILSHSSAMFVKPSNLPAKTMMVTQAKTKMEI